MKRGGGGLGRMSGGGGGGWEGVDWEGRVRPEAL